MVELAPGPCRTCLRAASHECEYFVVWYARFDVFVARSPINHPIDDRGAVDHRASARDCPRDFAGARVQRMHVARELRREDDTGYVRHAHRTGIDYSGGIGGLPKNVSRLHIQRRPGAARGGTSADQRVGFVIAIRNGRLDSLSVCCPFHAQFRQAWIQDPPLPSR
jgi:hypothetical protein